MLSHDQWEYKMLKIESRIESVSTESYTISSISHAGSTQGQNYVKLSPTTDLDLMIIRCAPIN